MQRQGPKDHGTTNIRTQSPKVPFQHSTDEFAWNVEIRGPSENPESALIFTESGEHIRYVADYENCRERYREEAAPAINITRPCFDERALG